MVSIKYKFTIYGINDGYYWPSVPISNRYSLVRIEKKNTFIFGGLFQILGYK